MTLSLLIRLGRKTLKRLAIDQFSRDFVMAIEEGERSPVFNKIGSVYS